MADRSGFSASALRYYEGIGLVEPATRTDARYRIYDDHTLARLAFISRAKQLGCSLEEITDLVPIWVGDRCGPVQRRFHELIAEKIHSAQRQLAELAEFSTQPHAAAEHLSGEPVDGPCGEDCACVTDTAERTAEVSPVMLVAKPVDVPIACTLEPGAMPDRLADWNTVLDRATARTAIADGGLRIEFGDTVDLARLASLIAAGQQCCAFFSFALTVDHRGIALEVHAPDGAGGIVAAGTRRERTRVPRVRGRCPCGVLHRSDSRCARRDRRARGGFTWFIGVSGWRSPPPRSPRSSPCDGVASTPVRAMPSLSQLN